MKIKITYVPKNECPLETIAKLGKKTNDAWIFIHKEAFRKLMKSCDLCSEFVESTRLLWKKTDEHNETTFIIANSNMKYLRKWLFITKISSENIDFTEATDYPKEIFFIALE